MQGSTILIHVHILAITVQSQDKSHSCTETCVMPSDSCCGRICHMTVFNLTAGQTTTQLQVITRSTTVQPGLSLGLPTPSLPAGG